MLRGTTSFGRTLENRSYESSKPIKIPWYCAHCQLAIDGWRVWNAFHRIHTNRNTKSSGHHANDDCSKWCVMFCRWCHPLSLLSYCSKLFLFGFIFHHALFYLSTGSFFCLLFFRTQLIYLIDANAFPLLAKLRFLLFIFCAYVGLNGFNRMCRLAIQWSLQQKNFSETQDNNVVRCHLATVWLWKFICLRHSVCERIILLSNKFFFSNLF